MFKTNKKVLITGGSGNLGSVIRKILECDAPDSKELDVTDFKKCVKAVKKYDPDIIIHCAAWIDVAGAEKENEKCWQLNVVGTENMVRAANGRRFIFISTNYVFDGTRGMYKEQDIPNPINYYGLTKVVGEAIVSQYKETLIIRTTFKKDGPWPYKSAFIDQWMSTDFVSERAPDIIAAALMGELKGIIHIAGERKRIYDLAKRVTPNVGKESIKNMSVRLPVDTSLDSSLWKKNLSKLNRVKK